MEFEMKTDEGHDRGSADPRTHLVNEGIDRKATMGAVSDAMAEMHKKIVDAIAEFALNTGMEPEVIVKVEKCEEGHKISVVQSKASIMMSSASHEP